MQADASFFSLFTINTVRLLLWNRVQAVAPADNYVGEDLQVEEGGEHDRPGQEAVGHRRLHPAKGAAAEARSKMSAAGRRNLGAAEVPGC